MDEWKKERLTQAGINVEEALERFMGNDALLERFLKRFLEDVNFQNLCRAVDAQDADAALTASHTLKGLCGNLSMGNLSALFTRQVALLRGGDFPGAAAMMPEIEHAYAQTADAIRGCWS